MTCKETAFQASDYYQGVLSRSEVLEIEAHLENCENCREYFDQTRQLVAAMEGVPRTLTYSPKTRAQIMADFRAYHSVPRIVGIRREWVFAAAGVMAIAIAVVALWIVKTRIPKPAALQAATLDLTDRGPARGPVEVSKPPLVLPRANLDLKVFLPYGSEPGIYDLQVLRDLNPPIWMVEREARMEDNATTIHVTVDTSRWKRGRYSLGISAKGEPWLHLPLVLK